MQSPSVIESSTGADTGVFGAPSPDLAVVAADAVQYSPSRPGAARLEAVAPGALSAVTMAAPPGTIERRYTLALALRALRTGGNLTVMAPKDKGGSRLGKELAAFGCKVEETGRRHQRICATIVGPDLEGLDAALAAGSPQRHAGLGLWTQPGLFSWDRLDPGTALLMKALPALSGRGGDFGCGVGLLGRAVLESAAVTELHLIDIDRRAIDAAALNIEDMRASLHWADVRTAPDLTELDFVVMNPPFHDGGAEDKVLGLGFIQRAHAVLKKRGVLWIVANRHLPYEAVLTDLFSSSVLRAEGGGFKVYEARK